MTDLLRGSRIIICAGTGGVGKTSVSACLGVLAAREGLKTLVLTIDPAQRLAQSLGIDRTPGEELPVPSVDGLFAAMIDPHREFDEFVLGAVDKGIARDLFKNPLYQQLVGNLNGSQEFTSLVKLLNAHRSGKYDLVILDTPPTQNAVDFLKAPDRLYALFQDTVIGWFANPQSDEGWIKRTLHRGTRIVSGALETVTGSKFIAELKDFFQHISHLKGRIAEIGKASRDLIHSDDCGFLLVTGFDEAKLKEALEFQHDLVSEKLNLRGVIVNRWFPEWTESDAPILASWQNDPDYHTLKQFYDHFARYFSQRQEAFEKFTGQLGKSVPVIKLPDFKNAVQGLDDLNQMAQVLSDKWRSQT